MQARIGGHRHRSSEGRLATIMEREAGPATCHIQALLSAQFAFLRPSLDQR
jgi:hypothetical protein